MRRHEAVGAALRLPGQPIPGTEISTLPRTLSYRHTLDRLVQPMNETTLIENSPKTSDLDHIEEGIDYPLGLFRRRTLR
jgi:hypothetical protein